MKKRKVTAGQGLDKFLEGEFGKFKYQVGILENKQHFAPYETQIGTLKGKPIYQKHWYTYANQKLLKPGANVDGTLFKIAREMDQMFMWLRKPWVINRNKDIISVINFIVDNLNGRENKNRLVNAIQAVVRNPILRGDYGRNSQKTAKDKGFNKLLMATGQLFKNIKAKLTNV